MICTIFTIGYLRFLPLFTTEPVLIALLANLDFLLFLIGGLVGIANVLLTSSAIILVSVVSGQIFKGQQKVLEQEKMNFSSSVWNTTAVFRYEHTKWVHFLTAFNEALSSTFFATYLLGNLGYNAYSFVFIAYNTSDQSLLFRCGYAAWQVLHGCTPLGVATFVVAINRRMYSSEKVIAGILAKKNPKYSGKKFCREKWKLPCYLELLDGAKGRQRTRTMGLGAGVFGVIEMMSLLEFAFIYVAFLLHFGGLMLREKKSSGK